MAASVSIQTRARSFAIGLAVVGKNGSLKFVKSFRHEEENDKPVRDFFRILAEASLYSGGDTHISITKAQAEALLTDFEKHKGTLEFLEAIGKHGGLIVIMHRRKIPTTYADAALLEHLLRPEKLKKKKTKKKK